MPKILHKQIVAESDLFKIESVGLEFSNGNTRIFERFLGTRNSVMVIPLLDKDTLLLVKEYAVGTERYEITFPKGIIDQNEDLHVAANRELKEEIMHSKYLGQAKIFGATSYLTQHSIQNVLNHFR